VAVKDMKTLELALLGRVMDGRGSVVILLHSRGQGVVQQPLQDGNMTYVKFMYGVPAYQY
jgi:hypothetical protein